MNEKPVDPETDALIEDVRARQSNTLWPDALRNGRSVDAFLWKGDPNAPLVQRIGAWIFGLTFILIGLCSVDIAFEKPEDAWPWGAFSVILFMIGGKVFLNGFRRASDREPPEE
ncbi:MAG TPA: hypothetical protein VHZ52_13010 [Acidobacteriaceae bacterium]|jgi:hypothetical protein|nr:hypothetical protein [Acidobacteriaceae bacterium]